MRTKTKAARVAEGLLVFCTRPGFRSMPVEHTGRARLAGAANGMLLFVDLESGIELWLHPDELIRFDTRDGAS